jgi:hypothetical protein
LRDARAIVSHVALRFGSIEDGVAGESTVFYCDFWLRLPIWIGRYLQNYSKAIGGTAVQTSFDMDNSIGALAQTHPNSEKKEDYGESDFAHGSSHLYFLTFKDVPFRS